MPHIHQKIWIEADDLDTAAATKIALQYNLPKALATILVQRGYSESAQVDDFLNPSLNQLPSPFLMKGMQEAVEILSDAIKDQLPIIIYGDYDADGVTASAVLTLFFRKIGVKVINYIPDRFNEGYGLSENAINAIYTDNKEELASGSILITVDCGISNPNEVELVKSLGGRVIITDHHQPPAILPGTEAILNPIQPGCEFPFKDLAGVGVAFYLAMGLRSYLNKKSHWQQQDKAPNLKSFLDLVSIGTIADMVPLKGVNRVLVRAGLEVMADSVWPGIRVLINNNKLGGREINATDIGFKIGPMINAAGRIASADIALRLLICNDTSEAKKLALELEEINQRRRLLTVEMTEQVRIIAAQEVESGKKGLVIYHKTLHEGVIGLVASRLMNEFGLPAIVLTDAGNGLLKGSCRSIDNVNIVDILAKLDTYIEKYGGHKSAAGLSLKKENLEPFTDQFNKIITDLLADSDLRPKLTIDCRAALADIFSAEFIRHYQRLGPFGMGNREPVFSYSSSCEIFNKRVIGAESIRFSVKEKGLAAVNGIGFGMAKSFAITSERTQLAFTIQLNDFRGKKNWEIRAVDVNTL